MACLCWAYAEKILSHAEHTRNPFHRMLSILGTNLRACSASGKMWTFLDVQSMLSIRGMNFITHWAYEELISSHAEHTGNQFHRMLSMRGNVKSNISAESKTIFKNLVLQALGTIRIWFLQKISKQKFHACVPLKGALSNDTILNPSLFSLVNTFNAARRCPFYIVVRIRVNHVPHCSGRIYTHLLRRPGAGKGLKRKKYANSAIPWKMSCKQIPLTIYPPKKATGCLI